MDVLLLSRIRFAVTAGFLFIFPPLPAFWIIVANSSSSEYTLKIMLIMTCLGLPIVPGYTIWAYRVFAYKAGPEGPY